MRKPRYRQADLRSHYAYAAALLVVLLLGSGAQSAPAPSQAQAPLSVEQIFQSSAPAVVVITLVDTSGKPISQGTGFIVDPTGVIVTNHHVIEPRPDAHLVIKVAKGDQYDDVRVIYDEERRDIAVLLIKAKGLHALKIGDSDKLAPGQQVVAIGNPLGLELTITEGIISGIRLDQNNGYHFIQHQAPISPGSSGGPLLNMRGEVIGINSFTFVKGQNLNGAIPVNYVTPYLHDTAKMTYEEYARQKLGTTSLAPRAPVATTVPASSAIVLTPHRGALVGSFEARFGMTPRDIVDALGTPTINGLTPSGDGFIRYSNVNPPPSGQISTPGVSFFFQGAKLVQISTLRNNAKTSSGVAIGDAREKVVQVYGFPHVDSASNLGAATYSDLGLFFYFSNDGIVEAITIREP